MPSIKELKALFVHLKKFITDDMTDEHSSAPLMVVTIGAEEGGRWSYQTGDNSFTGGAYGYPHWAVVYLTRRSNSDSLARDVRSQLSELFS